MNPIISFRNVSFSYEGRSKVLDDINFTIRKGSFLGITGTNGSGKSTFSYLLNGLIPHHIDGNFSGDVLVDGVNTRERDAGFFARKVGLLFQNPDFSLFNLTVEQEILFGLENFGIKNSTKRVRDALDMVDMAGTEKRDPQTLSVGQKQKVCLASLLALDTDCLIMDEPVAQLDYRSTVSMYTLFEKIHKKGKTVIVIEHDTDLLYKYTGECLILDQGRLVKSGTTKKVLGEKRLLQFLGIKIPIIV